MWIDIMMKYLFMLIVFLFLIYHSILIDPKPIFAKLQDIAEREEYNHPYLDNKKVELVFLKKQFTYKDKYYDVLGIPIENKKFPYFWLVTNHHIKNRGKLFEKVIYICRN